MNTPNETPLDMDQISTTLHQNGMGGMPDVLELLIVEESLETYADVMRALLDPKNYNSVGNFQIDAKNIPRARTILGFNTNDPYPSSVGVCVDKSIMTDMIPVIEDAKIATAEKNSGSQTDVGPDVSLAA